MIRRYSTVVSLFLLVSELSISARSVKSSDVIDISMSVPLSSRIPCDGSTAPQDQAIAQATFSEGKLERVFMLSEFQKGGCKLDVKLRCLDKVPTGWRTEWASANTHPQKASALSLDSCYEWGAKDAAEYVVSGWYREGGVNKKAPWVQATVKQISTNPDVYEFSDPTGATGRLELSRR